MFQVFESRYEMPQLQTMQPTIAETICMSNREYYSLLTTLFMLLTFLIVVTAFAGFYFK